MTSQPLKIDFPIATLNQITLIQVSDRLTVNQAVAFKQTFQQICQASPAPVRIILDFSKTNFIDSSGIGVLAASAKKARQKKIELILWSVHTQVKIILDLTRMNKMFKIAPNTDCILPAEIGLVEDELPTYHPSVKSKGKRLIDIVGALVGLGITAVLFIPIAIAIKLDSPGPIFFSQIRCGWLGKPFRLWKFRSMVVNAEALKAQVENQMEGAFFKNENDHRITKVGRFLRRSSLDEFPQFWNVLKGDMSLVGTRPPTPDELDMYNLPEWQRLDTKPGLTGEWQVHGRSTVRKFQDVIELDLQYQKKWSFMYDIKLILKTIEVLFTKKNGAF